EVIWTRLLSLMLGPTVYAFSIILAVFLVGLGIGSSTASLLTRGMVPPRIALGCCQMLLTAAIAWTAWMSARSLPYWPINPSLSASPWFTFQLDLVRCFWALLPARLPVVISVPFLRPAGSTVSSGEQTRTPGRTAAAALILASIGAAAWLAWNVPKVPWALVAYGRSLPTKDRDAQMLYVGEGM